jgi:hypothetical protein
MLNIIELEFGLEVLLCCCNKERKHSGNIWRRGGPHRMNATGPEILAAHLKEIALFLCI